MSGIDAYFDEGASRGDLMLMGRLLAALDLLRRTGMSDVELAYDDDTGSLAAPLLWWVLGNWSGQRQASELFPYPAQAAEDLAARVVNGGECTHCHRVSVVGVTLAGHCCNMLNADDVDKPDTYRYVRTCELEAVKQIFDDLKATRDAR